MNSFTLIDTHAHFYPFCSWEEYFDHAWKNFELASGSTKCTQAILCLLETRNSDWYASLEAIAKNESHIGDWKLKQSGTERLLLLQNMNKEAQIHLIPGQQIISAENIEISIIGAPANLKHDMPAAEYLKTYANQATIIIPWGAGKWLGKRGELVSDLLSLAKDYPFALGDNRNRPSFWANIPQFTEAAKAKVNIVPGSDPLPISGQQKTTASFGWKTDNPIPNNEVTSSLRREVILNYGTENTYGKRVSMIEFIWTQALLRMKRIPDSPTIDN